MTSDMAGLCPAVPEVREYYKQLTEKFIRDWDFDGHKLDFSYAVPRCYNPKHHHASPDDSTRAIGEIYKVIFDTTRKLKPESVTQSCPCGTPPNFAWLPYIDQTVTADPVGATQVRRRIKMYKALLGPNAAVYGDHVELTKIRGANSDHEEDEGRDFASTIGPGGVPGTKFTWPEYRKKFRGVGLTPEKEMLWKKWLKIYDDNMLSRGTFLDLYVYGYDSPEAYAIAKDGKMYYAFFAPEASPDWKGMVQLRGLQKARYRIRDYENNASLGSLDSPDSQNANFSVHFHEHLLLEASPE
jgi:alpha-galactosidase